MYPEKTKLSSEFLSALFSKPLHFFDGHSPMFIPPSPLTYHGIFL